MMDISSTLSGILGAKQLVVDITANILSGPTSLILFYIAYKSVCKKSPSCLSYITIGTRLAVIIDFKQVFWSIRDQITYFF